MTLIKADIIEHIQENCWFTKEESTQFAEAILEILKQRLESGEDVLISGFGKFYVHDKRPRRGRNPQTGKDLMLDSRRVVGFKCSPVLKGKMNRKPKQEP